MERQEILSVMKDAVKGVYGNYSKASASEAIRNALIEVNGGSTKINPKTFYRGSEVFNLVQELLPAIVEEGFKEDDPLFDNLVEYRNIADGDAQEFDADAESLFIVADAAKGVKGVRRQRIDDAQSVTVNTTMKSVRVYEDLDRLLAGKIDFDKFVERVGKSFKQAVMEDAYAAIDAISENTAGLDSTYVVTGSYNEDELIKLIEHVEAATGKTACIYGTKAALRKLTTATVSDAAKNDLYKMGVYGTFNGTKLIALKQVHKPGTSTFAFNDNKIFVIAGDDKPVKVVNEGDGIMLETPAAQNNDLTQEYFYGQGVGVGVICANKIGVNTLS